jgi:ATP-dependent Clp protease ATP-binding subunit ClpA
MNDRDRFDMFTERARRVLSLAQEESRRFQHNYIGTEHLLLGLVREGEGVAAKVLGSMGVELNKVRSSVEFIIGRGDRIVLGEIGLTPRAKKVIELAVDEARRFNHHYIGTEHLLLGLVREGEGIAAGVLESLGVNLKKVRTQTIQVLGLSDTLQQVTESKAGPVPQLMTELLTEARNVLLAVMQEKEQALQQKEYERAAELGKREKKLRDSISKLETFWHLQPRFAQDDYGLAAVDIVEDDTLDIFTVQLLRVLNLSQEEARRFQHNAISTEHLLLALVNESKGVAIEVLRILEIDTNELRETIEGIIDTGDRNPLDEMGFTPPAKKVIELAKEEAQSMKHHYVGIEHLLLSLVSEGEGIAAGVLQRGGATLEKVRAEIAKLLDSYGLI